MDRRHFAEDSGRRLQGDKLVSFVESSTRCEEMGMSWFDGQGWDLWLNK